MLIGSSTTQSDMVVRRAPIEDYGFEIAALDTRDAEPEAVPIPVDETGLVLSEHGIEKRQAQAVFFAAARIVLRRVLPRVIRAIVRILENNAVSGLSTESSTCLGQHER